MENITAALPWFLAALACAGLVLIPAAIVRGVQHGRWEEFAQMTGLTVQRQGWLASPVVSGSYRGLPTTLYTYSRTRSVRFGEKSGRTYTAVLIELPVSTSHWVKLTRENWVRRIQRSMGMQDIQIGDPAFDPEYMIGSDSPAYVKALLTPVIRAAMLGRGADMNFTVSKGTVYFTRPGVVLGAQNLNAHLDLLVMVARRVIEMQSSGDWPPSEKAEDGSQGQTNSAQPASSEPSAQSGSPSHS